MSCFVNFIDNVMKFYGGAWTMRLEQVMNMYMYTCSKCVWFFTHTCPDITVLVDWAQNTK